MTRIFLSLALVVCWSATAAAADEFPNRPLLGVNLDGFADFAPSLPFADLMKQSRPWQFEGGDRENKPKLDRLGNWIPEEGKTVFSIVALPEAVLPGGTFVVTWEGKGEIGFHSMMRDARMIKEEPGRMEFELPPRGTIALEIRRSDPSDPVRNVRCWLPGTEEQASPFNPAFKQYLGPFGTLRFMDWMHTNSSHQEKWANRTVPGQQTFRELRPGGVAEPVTGDKHLSGVPVEWMVTLCNEIGADPWFCMPHQADDEYVRNFAEYVKEHLAPERKIYLELSNEVWNTAPAFNQTQYARERGLEMGIAPDQNPSAAWYAKRSLEVWKIWEDVFGGRERHVRVIGGFAVNAADAHKKLEYLGEAKLADALAIAPYAGFSRDIRTGNFDPAGMSSQDLLDVINGQLDSLVTRAIETHARMAKAYGLELLAYESGISSGTPQKFHNDQSVVETFMGITDLPGVEDTMERYLRLWFAHGGKVNCLFAYVNRPSRWGAWGNMGSYLGQPDDEAPRRRGILKIARDPQLDLGLADAQP